MIRAALVIDGLNIQNAAGRVGQRIDFAALARWVADRGRREILFKHYYAGPVNGHGRGLQDEVEGMGYAWISCESPASGVERLKSTVDVMIVMDMVTWTCNGRVDVIFLATGDGDYSRVVHRVKEMGVQVCLLGIKEGNHVSLTLLREAGASGFYDLGAIGALRPSLRN